MEKEKKKSGKFKKVMIIVIVLLLLFIILGSCGNDEDDEDKVDDTNVEETTQTEKTDDVQKSEEVDKSITDNENNNSTSTLEMSDNRFQVGEAAILKTSNSNRISVTVTDWGTTKGYADGVPDKPVLYVKYMIENIGEETVYVGNHLFEVYADNYNVNETTVLGENKVGEVVACDLSSGRKIEGVLYNEINPEDASVIEVECGEAVFVLKDTTFNKVDLSDTDVPSDMKVDSNAIEVSELSGYYGGTLGQSYISISIYSSPEDIAVGNAEVYVEGGQYSYTGEICELETNVYKLANVGENVLMGFYTQNDEIMIQLYVDGQFIEEYSMGEHYES